VDGGRRPPERPRGGDAAGGRAGGDGGDRGQRRARP
jgi:hypothetical protein